MALRVLVTGGCGYLGSILSERLLDQGYAVTVLDNLLFDQKSLFHLCGKDRFAFRLGDARDEAVVAPLVKEADVVIPLAAIVGAPACDLHPHAARTTNLDAITMLLKLLSPSQLVVYPNTNSGYGTKSGASLCTEETPLDPISLYGETKVEAERQVLQFSNAITLRLATVFGMSPRPRLDLLVNHFVYAAVTDGYLVLFEKDFKRNFIHIRDVADCFVHCIEKSSKMIGRPYNVGLDEANISKGELAQLVKKHVPNFYVHEAAIRSDPDKRNYIVSNQRLREAGFVAKRSLDHGIKELLMGYKMLGRHPMKNV